MGRNIENQDVLLEAGQRVRVVRTVSIAIDVDIREYLDGDDEIWSNELEMDIEDSLDVRDMLNQWDDAEITDIKVEVIEIL